jgi:prepilin-type N-terminal cleavage/methylation domain-containing protein
MKKNILNQKGFTLIELVVVSTIIVGLGLIFTEVLVQALRGENKVKIIASVRQNGQTVLDQITNDIRSSEKVFCINDDNANTDTMVLFKEGKYIRYRFTRPLPTVNPTANGFIAIDSWDYLIDSYAACNNPQASPIKLTSDDPINGISFNFSNQYNFTERIFYKNNAPGFSDTVTIQMRGYAGVRSGRTYETTVAENGVLFVTTVSIRANK